MENRKASPLEIILFVHLCVFEPSCPAFAISPFHQRGPRPVRGGSGPGTHTFKLCSFWGCRFWCEWWRRLCARSRTCCTAQESTSNCLLRAWESVIEINVFTLEGRGSSNQCHRNQRAFTDSAGKHLPRPTWLSQDTNEHSSQFLNHAQILHLSVQGSSRLHTIHLASETGSHFCMVRATTVSWNYRRYFQHITESPPESDLC